MDDEKVPETRPVLYIQTLGFLNMKYDEAPFSLDTSVVGKVYQLFLLLAYAGKNGASRTWLQDELYDRNKTNVANALRINATRLRKLLTQTALPAYEYVRVDKNTYYLTEKEHMDEFQMDAVLMEQYWQKSRSEKSQAARRRLLENACQLYQGEFLPVLSGEEWVENLRSHFQDIYFQCVQKLCQILKQQGDYEKLVEVADAAMRLYPMEEWARLRIDAFVGMQKYADAMEAYKDAVRSIFAEDGMAVSNQMWERFRELRRYLQHQPKNLNDIRAWLCEKEWSSGAYCCSYPGFVDCFRMEARTAERGKRQGILMICTITDAKGNSVVENRKLPEYMEKLQHAVQSSLRRGDIYSRYSQEQILILANDLKEENADSVKMRIITAFQDQCKTGVELQIEWISLKEWNENPQKMTKMN